MDILRRSLLAVLFATAISLSSGCLEEAKDNATPPGTPPQQPNAAPTPGSLSASHILIMYKGSRNCPPHVTRSKEEALGLAKAVAEQAREPGADFAALARQFSEGPSGPKGGNMGVFSPAQMVRPFSEATINLEVGDVSDPVETDFGYHIILRQEVPGEKKVPMVSVKHILSIYKGAMRAPENISQTKEEARARIEECLEKLKAGGKFEELAKEYSDGPLAARGGDLGKIPQGSPFPLSTKRRSNVKSENIPTSWKQISDSISSIAMSNRRRGLCNLVRFSLNHHATPIWRS